MTDPLILSDGERMHPLWLKFEAHFRHRLAVLRSQNDGDHDPLKTAAIRGRISEIKTLLALADEPPRLD